MLTQTRLKEILHYNPETGMFVRRIKQSGVKQGKISGSLTKEGYLVATLNQVESLLMNDFIEVMYAADNTNISIATVAATAFAPAAPAAIITVTQTEQ